MAILHHTCTWQQRDGLKGTAPLDETDFSPVCQFLSLCFVSSILRQRALAVYHCSCALSCGTVLRGCGTTSLQINNRWVDAVLYFKKHMGPTLLFHPCGCCRHLNLALWQSVLAAGSLFQSWLHHLLAVWLWAGDLSILSLTFHLNGVYLTEFLWRLCKTINLCIEFSRKIGTWKELIVTSLSLLLLFCFSKIK